MTKRADNKTTVIHPADITSLKLTEGASDMVSNSVMVFKKWEFESWDDD
jgi:hypothetical protein